MSNEIALIQNWIILLIASAAVYTISAIAAMSIIDTWQEEIKKQLKTKQNKSTTEEETN